MKKQSGFTLIEIVMVLVLLGILTAVAVPKYFDLQAEANERAAATFAAEYQARLNAHFAKALMATPTPACSDARTTAITKTNAETDVVSSSTTVDNKTTHSDGVVALSTDVKQGVKVDVTIWLKGNEYKNKYQIQLPSCSDDKTTNQN